MNLLKSSQFIFDNNLFSKVLYEIARTYKRNSNNYWIVSTKRSWREMTNMYNSKNKILQAYAWWFLGVFIFTLVLSAHAGDEEIDSLFTPVASMYSTPNDAAVGVAIPGSQQDVSINLIPFEVQK